MDNICQEMYAALNELVEMCRQQSFDQCGDASRADSWFAVRKALAAIKKYEQSSQQQVTMKYFLAEIYVTHVKYFGFWVSSPIRFSTTLVEAEDWEQASNKTEEWASKRMSELSAKYKWKAFASAAI